VGLAARGTRDLDDGPVPVLARAERAALRRRARRVRLQAAALTLSGVALALAVRFAVVRPG